MAKDVTNPETTPEIVETEEQVQDRNKLDLEEATGLKVDLQELKDIQADSTNQNDKDSAAL